MLHAVALRIQIARVVRVRLGTQRHLFNHFQTETFQSGDLLGVIRQELKLSDANV